MTVTCTNCQAEYEKAPVRCSCGNRQFGAGLNDPIKRCAHCGDTQEQYREWLASKIENDAGKPRGWADDIRKSATLMPHAGQLYCEHHNPQFLIGLRKWYRERGMPLPALYQAVPRSSAA